MTKLPLLATAALSAGVLAGAAEAAVVRVTEANFRASAGLITFSEFGLNTQNPTYSPSDYGGDAGSPTLTTGGLFLGQSLAGDAATVCPGASPTGCVVGDPTAPLSLDPEAPVTFITGDSAAPNSPVLSGTPRFNGPVALLFSEDQLAVGFDAGFFDAEASTGITALARDGSVLGTVTNEGLDIEFLGLVSADGEAEIAGVFLDLVGSEPAGFAVDSIRFGEPGDVILPPDVPDVMNPEPPLPPSPSPVPSPVPLPAGLPLLAAGLAGLALLRRRG